MWQRMNVLMGQETWLGVGFVALVIIMLVLDLGLLNRKAHTPSYREAATWSAVWVTLALCFGGVIFWQMGAVKGTEFLTGYVIELSLSVDNLFVFLLIFGYFKVPAKYQHRVLFWGVMGALVMRVTIILLGSALIERFHFILYLFGAFLIYTGIKMLFQEDEEIDPENSAIIKVMTRFVPITRRYEGEKFFIIENGKRTGTLLFLVLVIVEVSDLVFAVDSIPAIFGITRDPFIIYTSNVFAIMGLRSLFFLLAGVVEKFHYLKIGLAIVLTLIGVKMLVEPFVVGTIITKNMMIFGSLIAVALVLSSSVIASVIWPIEMESEADVATSSDDQDS